MKYLLLILACLFAATTVEASERRVKTYRVKCSPDEWDTAPNPPVMEPCVMPTIQPYDPAYRERRKRVFWFEWEVV